MPATLTSLLLLLTAIPMLGADQGGDEPMISSEYAVFRTNVLSLKAGDVGLRTAQQICGVMLETVVRPEPSNKAEAEFMRSCTQGSAYAVAVVVLADGRVAGAVSYTKFAPKPKLREPGQAPFRRPSKEVMVAEAAKVMEVAAALQGRLRPTETFPLPALGRTHIYVITRNAVLTTDVDAEQLNKGTNAFSTLHRAANHVLTFPLYYDF